MKKKSLKYRLMAILSKMMIACDKASFLISKKVDGSISLKERFSLKMHLIGCKVCRIYEKDIDTLNDYLKGENKCYHHLDNEQKGHLQGLIIKELEK